jgi:hypothetical protein
MELGQDSSVKIPLKKIVDTVKERLKPPPSPKASTRAERVKAYEERIRKPIRRE